MKNRSLILEDFEGVSKVTILLLSVHPLFYYGFMIEYFLFDG